MKFILLFRRVLHDNSWDSVMCSHLADSMQSSFFLQARFSFSVLFWGIFFFWGGGELLNVMMLNNFLVWYFYKSKCSNCQEDDLLFLTRTKVISWQLLLKLDFQTLLVSSKIVLTTWARHGCTALLLLKCKNIMLCSRHYVLGKMPLETENLQSFSFNNVMTKQKYLAKQFW